VVETVVSQQLPEHWLDRSTAPSSSIDKEERYERIRTSASVFLPSIESAELIGFLEGPRMVLPNREHTDERLSVVSCVDGEGFFSVFSGKIDHSVWVAEDVANGIFGGRGEGNLRVKKRRRGLSDQKKR
jgi:hypothetical protein